MMASVSLSVVNLENNGPLCAICNRSFAKYTCPKCSLRYCSVPCYKAEKHATCSESFYKESFMEALKHQDSISVGEKSKMMEILKRVEEADSSEDVLGQHSKGRESEDINERLSGLNIDNEAHSDLIWERLTGDEKTRFNTMVQTGELGRLIGAEESVPWWRELPKVQLLSDDANDDHIPLPSLPSDIPSLDSLFKDGVGGVSPCVRYNVLSVLYSYVFTVCLFNCDHHQLATSALKVLLQISAVLSDNLSFSSLQDAIDHPIATILTQPSGLSSSKHYCLSLIDELILLMEPRGVAKGHVLGVHALADILILLEEVNKELKQHKRTTATEGLTKQNVFRLQKKVLFLLSWCKDLGRDQLPSIIQPLKAFQANEVSQSVSD